MPEKLGGLNVPDIEQFWLAFKSSWLRRILSTQAFWPKIVLQDISKIQNRIVTSAELLNFGPTLLHNIGKKLRILFGNKYYLQPAV